MYALIKDNIVVQIQPNKQNGFEKVENNICCGMIKYNGKFINQEKSIEEKSINRLLELKQYLLDTDYKAIKAFEGDPSEDWEDVKSKRASVRQEIRELEK